MGSTVKIMMALVGVVTLAACDEELSPPNGARFEVSITEYWRGSAVESEDRYYDLDVDLREPVVTLSGSTLTVTWPNLFWRDCWRPTELYIERDSTLDDWLTLHLQSIAADAPPCGQEDVHGRVSSSFDLPPGTYELSIEANIETLGDGISTWGGYETVRVP